MRQPRIAALVLTETVVLMAVAVLFINLRYVLRILGGTFTVEEFQLFDAVIRAALIVAPIQITFFFNDLYEWRVIRNKYQSSIRLLESCSYSLVLIALIYFGLEGLDRFILKVVDQPVFSEYKASIVKVFVVMAMSWTVAYGFRRAFDWTLFRVSIADRLLVIGDGPIAETIESEIHHLKDPGYEVVGYILPQLGGAASAEAAGRDDAPSTGERRSGNRAADDENSPDTRKAVEEDSAVSEGETPPGQGAPERREKRILGGYGDILDTVKTHGVHRVIVCLPERRGNLPVIELLNCRLQGIKVEEGELLYERLTGKIAVGKLRPSYLIFSEGFNRSKFNYIFKRALDIIVALLGLFLAIPIIVATSILIKLESRGPIIFAQARVGKEGRIFNVFKFRSMRSDAEKHSGPVWATQDDDRITRIGHIIRKLRIDEIPQLWNVLRNEMSFVGPRPERPFFVEELKKDIPYYTERLVVKPGVTGWAQINYRYGASKEDAVEKLQYDLYYIKNMSIFLDVLILFRTVKVVLLGFGAR